ncbi:MAG: VOC family protein [Pseudomonadota bacterium]
MSKVPHGAFCWNELVTSNVEGAKAFYTETIGWTFQGMPMPDGGQYWCAMVDGRLVAGIMDMAVIKTLPPGTPPHWFSYLEVDDIDARVEKARAAGATIAREPWDVPNVGRIAVIIDPTGGAVGWMTSANASEAADAAAG